MKLFPKKNITLFLIFLVLGIWGVISYRLIHQQVSQKTETNKLILDTNQDSIMQRKSYKIAAYTKDPFLGKIPYTLPKKRIQSSIVEQINWPRLEYIGQLSSSKGNRYLFLLNGQTVLWKNGEEKQGMRLRKKRKELQIVFKKQIKNFSLNISDEKK